MIRSVLTVAVLCVLPVHAADVAPPKGFTALFNGKDLGGWHGRPTYDLRKFQAFPESERQELLKKWNADSKNAWSIEKGELVHADKKHLLTTDRDFGDVELRAEVKGEANIWIRGVPFFASTSKDWIRLRVVLVGERATVYLDDDKVLDHKRGEYDETTKTPIPAKGPIQLDSEGKGRWRNVFVREIPTTEANELLRKHKADGFKDVFNGKDFTGWAGPLENYEVVEGAIVCKPKKGGVIFTKEEYTDFVARLEYRCPPGGNNGLALRYPGKGQASIDAMCEIQVLDDGAAKYAKLDPRQANGSAYGMAAAHKGYQRPVGEWNVMEVTVKGPTIQVEVNGTRVLDTDLSKVTQFMGGKPHPGKDRTSGNFGFCGHNDPVAFRNIQIKRLNPAK